MIPTISRIHPIVWMFTPDDVVRHREGEDGADGREKNSDSETHVRLPSLLLSGVARGVHPVTEKSGLWLRVQDAPGQRFV